MTAPLYDVKARLSEYITLAENGEIVEITKHGSVTAIIISKKQFDEMDKGEERPNFVESLKNWRFAKDDAEDGNESDEFCQIIENERKKLNQLPERRGTEWL